jgi:hypothetical protein
VPTLPLLTLRHALSYALANEQTAGPSGRRESAVNFNFKNGSGLSTFELVDRINRLFKKHVGGSKITVWNQTLHYIFKGKLKQVLSKTKEKLTQSKAHVVRNLLPYI